MSADTREVPVDGGSVTYDPDMPMRALKRLMRGADEGDLDAITEALSTFVVDWSFEGDPSDVDSWDDLTRTEFGAVLKGVMKDLGTLGEE